MKNIFKRSDHKLTLETHKEVEATTNEDSIALFLNIPKSIHAKFKAYSALLGQDMRETFIDYVESLRFKDVTRE